MEAVGGPDVLQELLRQECSPPLRLALQPFCHVLLCIADVLQTSGNAGFRGLLRLMDGLHIDGVRAKERAHRAETEIQRLSWELQRLHELCASERVQAWQGFAEQAKALAGETQARRDAERQVQGLAVRLADNAEAGRQQGLRAAESGRSAAARELSLHAAAAAQARTQAHLDSEHRLAVAELRDDGNLLYAKALRAEAARRSADEALQVERREAVALRLEITRLEARLSAAAKVPACRLPCLADVTEFLRDAEALALQPTSDGRLRRCVRLPVFLLEWPPGARLDVSPAWRNMVPQGSLGLLARLCSGEVRADSEELRLTVCQCGSRWFGAVRSELETARFSALLMYQALRLDLTVAAYCEIAEAPRALRGALDLDSASRGAPAVSASRTWHRAQTDEAVLRGIIDGCPFERSLLAGLLRAHPAC